ncbi:hypothetical protein KP509_07G018400 [Ceratopteris richardii]|nr:hypothetical protein KP509_07G018400 [Ceratopteris richardii]
MTLDGKIATNSGHSSWISSPISRERVFSSRARCDAVVIGGNTVRRDNPKLTTRKDSGHLPARIVLSCGLNLPDDAHLWDVNDAPTMVMTQRGANKRLQERLRQKGVEIVEFDFLSPKAVIDYCYERGFLSIFWECGGTLAALAISSGVIHKVMAFVAPKIIGGAKAPSPVGEMGMIEMTQALDLKDVSFEQIGPDMLVSGYLHPLPELNFASSEWAESTKVSLDLRTIISLNHAWDAYGAFSTFSPHSITAASFSGEVIRWKTVEHYYQAQKFDGVQHPLAMECVAKIKVALSPEEASRLGRTLQHQRTDLVRSDWDSVQKDIMYRALYAKFHEYPHLKSLLLSTSGSVLVDRSSHDVLYDKGTSGSNLLGDSLMQLRAQLLEQCVKDSENTQRTAASDIESLST